MINLEICCGTTCYMLGGSALLELERALPEEWRNLVEVRAVPCTDACAREDLGRAPFVRLNGELIANATREKIYLRLSELVDAAGGEK